MTKLTVAATQMACSWDAAENIARGEKLVREAAAKGAKLILLQELFETPYFCKDVDYRYMDLAVPIAENKAVNHFKAVAKELDIEPAALLAVAEIESGYGVWRASAWANQYQQVLKIPAADLSPVVSRLAALVDVDHALPELVPDPIDDVSRAIGVKGEAASGHSVEELKYILS